MNVPGGETHPAEEYGNSETTAVGGQSQRGARCDVQVARSGIRRLAEPDSFLVCGVLVVLVRCVVLCCVLRCVVLCCVVWCGVVWCGVVLCCVVLCCVLSSHQHAGVIAVITHHQPPHLSGGCMTCQDPRAMNMVTCSLPWTTSSSRHIPIHSYAHPFKDTHHTHVRAQTNERAHLATDQMTRCYTTPCTAQAQDAFEADVMSDAKAGKPATAAAAASATAHDEQDSHGDVNSEDDEYEYEAEDDEEGDDGGE